MELKKTNLDVVKHKNTTHSLQEEMTKKLEEL